MAEVEHASAPVSLHASVDDLLNSFSHVGPDVGARSAAFGEAKDAEAAVQLFRARAEAEGANTSAVLRTDIEASETSFRHDLVFQAGCRVRLSGVCLFLASHPATLGGTGGAASNAHGARLSVASVAWAEVSESDSLIARKRHVGALTSLVLGTRAVLTRSGEAWGTAIRLASQTDSREAWLALGVAATVDEFFTIFATVDLLTHASHVGLNPASLSILLL